jgi:hypothetical protein
MPYCRTLAAAKQLGGSYHQLIYLIRFGQMQAPERDSSGDFIWARADIERARRALGAERNDGPNSREPAPEMTAALRKVWTPPELARRWGCKPGQVIALIKDGKLKQVPAGVDAAASFASQQNRQVVRIVAVAIRQARAHIIMELSSRVPLLSPSASVRGGKQTATTCQRVMIL